MRSQKQVHLYVAPFCTIKASGINMISVKLSHQSTAYETNRILSSFPNRFAYLHLGEAKQLEIRILAEERLKAVSFKVEIH